MLNKKFAATAFAISAVLISASASAQVYVGGTIGQSSVDSSCANTPVCNTKDTAVKVLTGYNFNKNWGIETSYTSMGTVTLQDGAVSGNIKGSSLDASGVIRADLENNWGGFAKLGLAYVKAAVDGSVGAYSASTSTYSTQILAGAGVTYAIDKNIAIRAEIETRKVKLLSFSSRVTSIGVGAQFAF